MKKVIVGVAALAALGAVAWAASPSPLGGSNVSRGNLERIPDYNTVQKNAWYVGIDGGSDTGNSCLSPATPCATHQRVLQLISAKHLRHQQVIYTAEGDYPCVVLSGYQTDNSFDIATSAGSLSTTGGAGITIVGTMANSVLDGGTATGTISFSDAGSLALGVTFSAFSDTTQTWTPGNLRGRFVTFGNFTRQLIYDNSATQATVLTTATLPANGTAYSIQDAASRFNTSCTTGSTNGIGIDGGFNGPLTNQGAYILQDTTVGSGLIQYRLQQFGFANATGLDGNINTLAAVQFQDVQMQNVANTGSQRIAAGGLGERFTCTRCAFRRGTENNDNLSAFFGGTGFLSVTGSLFEGGRSAILAGAPQLLVSLSAMNPIQNFGFQLRGANNSITGVLFEGNVAPITACMRWGDSDGTHWGYGQVRMSAVTCRLNSFGGVALDVFAPGGKADVATSVFTSDAGDPAVPPTAMIRLNYGSGVDVDTSTVISTPSALDITLFQGQSGYQLDFGLIGIRASTPPCVSDATSNWLCSP